MDQKWGDVRDLTHQKRLAIGYKNVRGGWQKAKAEFTDTSLKICNHPVMERWETDYMRVLASIAARNKGTVLEVGFGLGISAGFIQQHGIGKHIIIEANREVFLKAREFARQSPRPVELLLGFWEEVIHSLPDSSLDGILFDTYPLSEEEIHCNHFSFFSHAFRLLKPNGVLTYYSDEIDGFSPAHMKKLLQAGFDNIGSIVCPVCPPENCEYWKSQTILAPIVVK